MVAREERRVRQRRHHVALDLRRVDLLHAPRLAPRRRLAAQHRVHVGFVWVWVFEVERGDVGDVHRSRGDDPGFDDELD